MKSLQTSVQWLSHAVSQWDNRVPSAGQACPKSGQRCPEAGQTCPKKSQPIEIIRLISLIDTVKNFTRRKPPISHFFYVKTAPCANRRLVRMVCTLPPRPKAKRSMSTPPFAAPALSPVPFLPSAARAGDLVSWLALAIVLAFAPVITQAQDWKPLSHSDRWQTRVSVFDGAEIDRFPAAGRAAPVATVNLPSTGSALDRLLALITVAEAPRGYDSIHYSAKRLPKLNPTEMTLAQIDAWTRATPGQHHAIGGFQIIPDTLRRVTKALGLPPSTRFDVATQKRMGRYLAAEAGYSQFMAGKLSRAKFMDNLARVWAGFPLASGRSAYHGYAGNKATMTRAQFEVAMQDIFG